VRCLQHKLLYASLPLLAALRGSLGLVVQLSCVTDVSVPHVVGRAVCLGCIKVNVYVYVYTRASLIHSPNPNPDSSNRISPSPAGEWQRVARWQVPCGVAVSGREDGGRIYVADYNNRRVVRLSRNARYDGCFVAPGASSTHLVQPQALDFVAADGRLVVVDRTHVKIFDVGVRPDVAAAPCPLADAPPSSTAAAAGDIRSVAAPDDAPAALKAPPSAATAAAAAAVIETVHLILRYSCF